MSRSWSSNNASLRDLNLSPATGLAEFPKVVQLVVVVILTAKDVQFVVPACSGVGSTRLGSGGIVVVILLQALRLEGLSVGHGELCEIVSSAAIDKTSKDKE